MRPLPLLTPDNEFFWTSGADGVLRFRRCAVCASYQHPMGPICRTCGSADLAPEAVSGHGVVVGFTINEHSWSPDFEPPYVVAIVAIDEDPRVRLTTNLVDIAHDEVFVGQRVSVVFEHVEDVWIPNFTARTDLTEPGPIPDDEPIAPHVRPMIGADKEKFEHKVALTGIGMSKISRHSGVDPLSLTIDACRQAVADAGLSMSDIDGLSTYPGGPAVERVLRGRGARARREPPGAADVVQRVDGDPRTGRVGRQRHAGRRRRPLPPRPVLPHGVGVLGERPAAGATCRRACASRGTSPPGGTCSGR